MDKNNNLASQICQVHIALCSIIDSVEQGSSGETYRSVEFSTGDWEKIEFTPGSASYEEPVKDTASGLLYNQALKLFYPGSDAANIAALEPYIGKPILVKITYSSGIEKLLGDLNNPVKLLPSYQIGERTGRNFDFKRQSPKPAFNYE